MKSIIVREDSGLAWIRLSLVFILCALGFIGMWSVVMILPSIESEFQITRSSVTIPYVVTMFGFGIGNIIIGKFSDRYGIQKPVIFGFIILISLYFISALSKNFYILSIIQFGLGFSSAVFFGPMMNDISYFFNRNRGLAVSITASAQHFAGAMWPFFLTFLLSEQKWREAHLLIAFVCIIFVPILCFVIFRINYDKKFFVNKLDKLNKKVQIPFSNNGFQKLLMIASIGCCVGMSTPQVHIIPLCLDQGLTIITGGKILSIMLFCAVLSRIIFGYISDIIGPLKTLLIGSTLQMITLILFIPFNTLTGLYVVSILFGLSQGGIVPSYALIVRKYLPNKDAAERIGLIIFFTIIGMSIGGWMSGKIYDYTYSYTLGFLNSIIWNLFNVMIIIYIFINFKKSKVSI